MNWPILILAIVLIVVLAIVAIKMSPGDDAASSDDSPPPFPPLPRGPVGELGQGMFTFGHLFRFDGSNWRCELEPPPATEPVIAVKGSALGTFAVTWDAVYRRTPSGWDRILDSKARLLSLWVDDENAWVGGARCVLMKWGGASFEQVPLPDLEPAVLGPIVVAASGDTFVAANTYILHGRGEDWTTEPIPTTDVVMDGCRTGDDVWFVVQSGEVLRSAGDGTWTVEHRAESSLGSICAASNGELWAVGAIGQILRSSGDGTWISEDSGTENQLLSVREVGGRIVVGDIRGTIHVRTPRGWEPIAGEARCEIRDFCASSDGLLVATSSFYEVS